MRKVTASAVILTALTGCSQSNAPSTQWSFKVPADDASRSADTALATSADGATETALVSARSSVSGAVASEISEDTRTFVSQSVDGRMMGPAFEQPSAEAPLGARVSTVGRPGSKEVSTLAAEAYGLTNGLSTQPSTRPDPVAQVRAYLRSSGSPSALTNRTPYSSEVYLSSLPTPNRYYEPSMPVVDTEVPIGTSGLGLSESLPAPVDSTPSLLTQPVSNDFQTSTLIGSDFIQSGTQADFAQADSFADPLPQVDAQPVVSTFTSDYATADYSTPDYSTPSYADSYAVLPASSSEGLSASEEPASIGTAILQDLQRENGSSAPDTYDAGLPSLTASSSPIDATQYEPSQYEPSRYEPSQYEPSQLDLAQLDTFQVDSAEPTRASTESTYAYAPAVEPQRAPSLASLTASMPERDIAPIVDSFRSQSGLPAGDLPVTNGSRILDYSPSSEADIEALRTADYPQQSYASEINLAVSDTISPSLDASEAYSPLLQGLSETEATSTIYVPIADDSEAIASSILLQDVANTLDTLKPVSSATKLASELTPSDIFSSILSSSALASDEPLITLTSLHAHSEDKAKSKRSQLKASQKKATLTLASKPSGQRRQRIVWM